MRLVDDFHWLELMLLFSLVLRQFWVTGRSFSLLKPVPVIPKGNVLGNLAQSGVATKEN